MYPRPVAALVMVVDAGLALTLMLGLSGLAKAAAGGWRYELRSANVDRVGVASGDGDGDEDARYAGRPLMPAGGDNALIARPLPPPGLGYLRSSMNVESRRSSRRSRRGTRIGMRKRRI